MNCYILYLSGQSCPISRTSCGWWRHRMKKADARSAGISRYRIQARTVWLLDRGKNTFASASLGRRNLPGLPELYILLASFREDGWQWSFGWIPQHWISHLRREIVTNRVAGDDRRAIPLATPRGSVASMLGIGRLIRPDASGTVVTPPEQIVVVPCTCSMHIWASCYHGILLFSIKGKSTFPSLR